MMRGWMGLVLLVICAGVCGCGGIRDEELVPKSLNVTHHEAGSVFVNVGADQAKANDSVWVIQAQVTDHPQVVKRATETAITKYNVFQSIAPAKEQSSYVLDIQINNATEPPAGGNFNAGIDAHWTLIQTSSNRVVWQHDVSGTGHSEFFEAFAGAERSRNALERAVADHIGKGLEMLSKENALSER